MKQFQDLELELQQNDSDTISLITKNIKTPWSRNIEKEKEIAAITNQICFEYKTTNYDASLWLIERDNKLVVSNIVPNKLGQLLLEDYNSILNIFVEENIKPLKLHYNISKDEILITDLLSQESIEKLKLFSNNANKSTGRSHPLDEKRWFEFIFSMIKNKEYIEYDKFQYLLIELGWDIDSASNLVSDFEYGYDLIKYYESKLL